jgi:2-hydroxychromene-2-carboxylate isomerase
VTAQLTLYVDFRSPYSYLAKDEAYALARELAVEIETGELFWGNDRLWLLRERLAEMHRQTPAR